MSIGNSGSVTTRSGETNFGAALIPGRQNQNVSGLTTTPPKQSLTESSDALSESMKETALVAMNSLRLSTNKLTSLMLVTNDPKEMVDIANAIAGSVQTSLNIIKLAKSLRD